VVGPPKAGKTTLLKLLAGRHSQRRGEIAYDGALLDPSQSHALAGMAALVEPHALWPKQKLSRLLQIAGREAEPEVQTVLAACGMDRVIARLRKGLRTRVSSASFSESELKTVAIARAMLSERSLLLLDDSLSESKREMLPGILAACRGRTVVYASREALAIESFTSVIHLERGRVTTNRSVPSTEY
jgi:ABC-type transport system involved in cytochrome bd biosynthesis fused ATPase/permease subunit